jgi:hypothetical protein
MRPELEHIFGSSRSSAPIRLVCMAMEMLNSFYNDKSHVDPEGPDIVEAF